MTFDITTVGNLKEYLTSFSFRNEGQISIPKGRREKAYEQSIDIIIDSVAYPQYVNGKSLPPLSFFGYVTLVYQDCFVVEVPLHFPRQRVYYERQWSAQIAWQAEKTFWENYQFHRKNDISLATIMGALEIPYEEIEPNLKPFAFVELPLREVYVKLLSDSQFTIEYRQMEPIPYTDPFANYRTGESNQTDGSKDDGIPQNGLLPLVNPADNPWVGNDTPNEPSFESGFRLPTDKLFKVGSDRNEIGATETTEGYYLEIPINVFPSDSGQIWVLTNYVSSPLGSVVSTENIGEPFGIVGTVCIKSIMIQTIRVYVEGTSFSLAVNSPIGTSVNAVERYGLLPSTTFINTGVCA